MRILVLNWRDIRSPQAGGSEGYLHEVLVRLVQFGHECTLVCGQFAGKPGMPEETFDRVRTLRTGSWWNAHWSVPHLARRILGEQQFDLVLDNVNKVPFFAPRWSPVPVVAVFYHLLGRTVFRETNPLFATAILAAEHRIARVYRNTPSIAISLSTAEDLLQSGLPKGRISICEPGVDHDVFRPAVAQRDTDPLVLVVSRLKNYKRVDVAIRAFARIRAVMPAARLVVIGGGDAQPGLAALARDLRLPVTFTGPIPESEKVRWLNRAHVVLNPSMKEGWGLVGVEAMACGTPVVASDVPGHRDSVPAGGGVLVPLGDDRAMAEAALRFMTDENTTAAACARGLAFAGQLTWDRTATGISNILDAVVATPASNPSPLVEVAP